MAKKKNIKREIKKEAEKAFEKMPFHKQVAIFLAIVLVIAILAGCYYFFVMKNEDTLGKAEGDLVVHFIDVGQGDSIFIQLPDNKTMIIDGGPRSSGDEVQNYLKSLKIKTIDYLLLTHTDEDHVGELDDVLLEFEVKNIYMPDVSTMQITTGVYKDFVEAVELEKKAGAEVHISLDDSDIIADNYKLDFFVYEESYEKFRENEGDAERKNSVSPLVFLTYADVKVLLTGDANEETEHNFLEKDVNFSNRSDFDVDILKVGHHGSSTSTTAEFLEVVKPEYAIIQCGEDNKHFHPRQDALDRLKKYVGANDLYRTDTQGNVVLTIKDDGQFALESDRAANAGANWVAPPQGKYVAINTYGLAG